MKTKTCLSWSFVEHIKVIHHATFIVSFNQASVANKLKELSTLIKG
jgi:hypothetical protein